MSRPASRRAHMARATTRVAPTNRRGRACPVPPADGPHGAGDHEGRPYGTVGDGLVPSRQPAGPHGAGDHEGRPYGTVGDGLVPSRQPTAHMARATTRVAPTEPWGTGLSRPASRRPTWRGRPRGSPLRNRGGRACPVPPADGPHGAGDHEGRPYGTVGDGLVPSRQPTAHMARATTRVAPTEPWGTGLSRPAPSRRLAGQSANRRKSPSSFSRSTTNRPASAPLIARWS